MTGDVVGGVACVGFSTGFLLGFERVRRRFCSEVCDACLGVASSVVSLGGPARKLWASAFEFSTYLQSSVNIPIVISLQFVPEFRIYSNRHIVTICVSLHSQQIVVMAARSHRFPLFN